MTQDHSYGTIEEEGEGTSRMLFIIMGVVIVILAGALIYVYVTSSSSSSALLIGNLRANITALQAEVAALKLQHGNTSVTGVTTAPTTTALNLEYNRSVVLLSNYYKFFGYSGYSIPNGVDGIPASGPLNLTFGPYTGTGYLNITYFTAPSTPITLKVYQSGGSTALKPKSLLSNYLIPLNPDQVDLLSLSATPKDPYNALNNSFYAQVTVVYIPSG
jgi:hypothetical protein